jgi:hypothetical protein
MGALLDRKRWQEGAQSLRALSDSVHCHSYSIQLFQKAEGTRWTVAKKGGTAVIVVAITIEDSASCTREWQRLAR